MQRPNISKQQLPVLSVRTTESVNDKCHTWRGRLDKRGVSSVTGTRRETGRWRTRWTHCFAR